jgi:hypothetical protein
LESVATVNTEGTDPVATTKVQHAVKAKSVRLKCSSIYRRGNAR